MKLTAEQIAAFEARAEAGEKPMEDMWDEEPEEMGWPGDRWLSMQCSSLVVQSFAEGDAVLHLPTLGEVKFSSVPAAQLAAEHLLREATRGLHAEAYRAIGELREWHAMAVETLQARRTGSNSHENAWRDGARHKAEGQPARGDEGAG